MKQTDHATLTKCTAQSGLSVAATPLAVSAQSGITELQRLYADWVVQTDLYRTHEGNWKSGQLSDQSLEDAAGTIFDRRDALEDQIFSHDCRSTDDLHILIAIAGYYDWSIECYNEAVGKQSAVLVTA